jgi:crossover junction endodeoxyribonuclease RusA
MSKPRPPERPLDVTLPWPPSVNHYWGARGRRRFLSAKARAWHEEAGVVLRAQRRRYKGPVALYVMAYPPDRRRRDLDNLLKGVLDALVGAGVLKDDYQVAEIHVARRPPERPGKVRVVVEPIESD